MDWPLTTALLIAALALAAFCSWRGRRPADLTRGPRMTPYGPLMLLAVTLAVFLFVHLIKVLGLL